MSDLSETTDGIVFTRFARAPFAGWCVLDPTHPIADQSEIGYAVMTGAAGRNTAATGIGWACPGCVLAVMSPDGTVG